MSRVDVVGHIGYVLIGGGHLLLATGYSPEVGWPLRLAGELVWTGIGLHLRLSSVWAWGLGFAALDLWAAINAL